MDSLHYHGNVDLDKKQVYGPDLFGAHYRAFGKSYNAETNTTTLFFNPIPPSELGVKNAR
jgi:hypothetical protein